MHVERLQDRRLQVAWTESVSSADAVQINWFGFYLQKQLFAAAERIEIGIKYWIDFI